VSYLVLVRPTSLMIVPLLVLIVIGLSSYTGFLKLAARLLRYSVSWKSSFIFSGIMLAAFIFIMCWSLASPRRYGLASASCCCSVSILGGWFFSGRGTNRDGSVLGWSGGMRLMALMFAMMLFVGFAIVIPAQVFLSKHLSSAP